MSLLYFNFLKNIIIQTTCSNTASWASQTYWVNWSSGKGPGDRHSEPVPALARAWDMRPTSQRRAGRGRGSPHAGPPPTAPQHTIPPHTWRLTLSPSPPVLCPVAPGNRERAGKPSKCSRPGRGRPQCQRDKGKYKMRGNWRFSNSRPFVRRRATN